VTAMSISSVVRDRGRLIVLPLAVFLGVAAAASLSRGLDAATGRGVTASVVLRLVTTVLVCCFYAVVVWCYLRRERAVATSHSRLAHLVAVVATLTPFGFALLPGGLAPLARSLAASVLLVAGTGWSVWALRSLGGSLSMLAQARAVVQSGPYRWVRHPLYLGEVVASLGLALTVGSAAAALLWLTLCAMQVYRATREEEVLARTLPDYVEYRARTSALLPGVF
jgi:protein-S-isoprenylcysteine O-methyltransferase Ste14